MNEIQNTGKTELKQSKKNTKTNKTKLWQD